MTSNHFEVTTASLRSVAAALDGHADTAGTIADQARAADLDTKSWGALGLGLGLYAGYISARSSADRSIGEVKSFLADARTAVQSSARDYDEADAAAARMFAAIESAIDSVLEQT